MGARMTDYANAPAPHGALFDNAPTAPTWFARSDTATVTRVAAPSPLCRDYVDGVVSIWANGRTQRGRCRRDRVMTVQQARDALAHGAGQVFVMAGDVEAVRSGDKNG